jgi:organic hydroperoxide reductase OsmC/OhrA
MNKEHHYTVQIEWTGNRGKGTVHYTEYDRNHILRAAGKPDLACSSDTAFRGDASRYNPEDMLVASLSSCHMLWYLHLCADAGVVVTAYIDKPKGVMLETAGSGHFTEVVLHPEVTIANLEMKDKAISLHDEAHKRCFIANSVNFPVTHIPVVC